MNKIINKVNFNNLFLCYMKERNGSLLAFIKGVMGDAFGKRENAVFINNAVDIIQYLTNSKFVGPLTFAKALLI